MMKPRLPLLLALAVLACTARDPVERVVVADRGVILRTISDPNGLQSFEQAWLSRQETHFSDAANWQYKLTIGADDESQIWLYDPAGYTRLLAMTNTPTYRLPDFAAFNALLGVPEKPMDLNR